MNAPRIRSLSVLSSSTISRSFSTGTWITSPGSRTTPERYSRWPVSSAELAQEAVGSVDGDDAVLPPVALDDRYRPRLDHEEVARLVALGEQNVAGFDAPDHTEGAQPLQLTLVQAREGAIAVGGLRRTGADW